MIIEPCSLSTYALDICCGRDVVAIYEKNLKMFLRTISLKRSLKNLAGGGGMKKMKLGELSPQKGTGFDLIVHSLCAVTTFLDFSFPFLN